MTTSYVVELGCESGDGEFKQWESRGFYAGYVVDGPIIVNNANDAMRFPTKERAGYMPAGDVRLRDHRIIQVEAEPTV